MFIAVRTECFAGFVWNGTVCNLARSTTTVVTTTSTSTTSPLAPTTTAVPQPSTSLPSSVSAAGPHTTSSTSALATISPTSNPTPEGESSNVGVIAGGTVGGVTAIALGVALLLFLFRRRRTTFGVGNKPGKITMTSTTSAKAMSSRETLRSLGTTLSTGLVGESAANLVARSVPTTFDLHRNKIQRTTHLGDPMGIVGTLALWQDITLRYAEKHTRDRRL
ncbi:hypothetical protein HDU93_009842, partial [Gonapodya sp. JEL0774]